MKDMAAGERSDLAEQGDVGWMGQVFAWIRDGQGGVPRAGTDEHDLVADQLHDAAAGLSDDVEGHRLELSEELADAGESNPAAELGDFVVRESRLFPGQPPPQ